MREDSIYDSERLAAAYAHARPPVHRAILEVAERRLVTIGVPRPRRALDIGCGAGLSTAALGAVADACVGIDPVHTMVRMHATVPGAHFVVGRAEHLPFADSSFGFATAAGALNYADPRLALPEIARVLTRGAVLLVYDFSAGCRLRDDQRLEAWFAAFLARYAYPPGYAMDVTALPWERAGLALTSFERFDVEVAMSGAEYLAYVMSETNVERAIREGTSEGLIRDWCSRGLERIFFEGRREVGFPAELAIVRRE